MAQFPDPIPATTPREVPGAVYLGAWPFPWMHLGVPIAGLIVCLHQASTLFPSNHDRKLWMLGAFGSGALLLLVIALWAVRIRRAVALYRDGTLVDGRLAVSQTVTGAVKHMNYLVRIPDGEVALIALNQGLGTQVQLVSHRGWAGIYLSEHNLIPERTTPAIFRCGKIRKPRRS